MKLITKMLILLIFSTAFLSFTIPTTNAKYAQDIVIGSVDVKIGP